MLSIDNVYDIIIKFNKSHVSLRSHDVEINDEFLRIAGQEFHNKYIKLEDNTGEKLSVPIKYYTLDKIRDLIFINIEVDPEWEKILLFKCFRDS